MVRRLTALSDLARKRILVAGAGGALGRAVVEQLRARGASVIATMRTRRPAQKEIFKQLGVEVRYLDLEDTVSLRDCLRYVDGAIFTPILSVSAVAAQFLRADQSVVFFSSNNVAIDPQAEVYARLLAAEKVTLDAAPHAVILRPTMIYGYPGDGNLSKLMAAMKRLPVTPMPGGGAALQQPLFYKDLASAAVDAFFNDDMRGAKRSVAGPDAVTQRALYAAAAKAAGVKARSVGVPVSAAATMLRWIEATGLRLPVSAAQLRRATIDKTPRGDNVIVTATSLDTGLAVLASALDAGPRGA